MKLVGILAGVLLPVGGAGALGGSNGHDGAAPVAIGNFRLVSVDSCDDLLEWFRTTAQQTDVNALGGDGGALAIPDVASGGAVATSAVPSMARDSAEQAAGPSVHSDTNVQERGV